MAFDLDSAVAVDAGGPEVFARLYGPAAKRAAMQIGVDTNLLLAQWGNETGWGKSIVPGTNNLGNIKDFSGGGTAARDNATGSRDRYRKFDSPEDFADAYAQLVKTRYPDAMGAGADPAKFTAGLKGYAQDKGYGGKVAAAFRTVGRALSSVIPSAQAAEAPTGAGFDLGSAQAETDAATAAQPTSGASAAGFDLASAKPVDEASAPPARRSPMQARQDPSFLDVAAARASSFGHGIKDPITGGAQLLTHMLPDGVVQGGNRLNNWLAKYGLVSEMPKGGMDAMVRQDDAELAARRREAGLGGIDWMRVAGNVASPVNYVLPAAAPRGLGFAGRAAVTGAQGAVAGAMAPVDTEGDFWRQKTKQVATGAVTGAATTGLASGLARVISPNVRPEVRALIDAGVSMTPGQAVGGAARKFEEKLSSVPFVGDIIKSAEARGIRDFNRAAIEKSMESIGAKLPKGMTSGHDAIEFAGEAIGDKYDKLLPKLTGRVDRQFVKEVAAVRNLGATGLPADKAAQLDRIIDKEILGRFGAKGGATGQTLKQIESKLGEIARQSRRSSDYDVRNMGDAAATLQKSLRDMLARNNPKYAQQLKDINSAYSQFLRVQTAAARQGAKEGVFTPAQLRSAVRQLDSSKGKSAFAKGKAGMQDMAEAGTKVLSNTVPDSGTSGRAMAGALALGAPGLWNPLFGLGVAAAPFYTPLGQKAAQAALTARPQGANALANLVRENDRLVGAGTIPLSMLPVFLQGVPPQK